MNTRSNLIGISGIKNSGKDCVAYMLQYCLSVPKLFRQYGIYKYFNGLFPKIYNIKAFANPLKEVLSILLNVPVQKFNSRDFKENYCVDFKTLRLIKIQDVPSNLLLSSNNFSKMSKSLDLNLKNYYLTIRQVMQVFGTDYCRRLFGADIGINLTLANNRIPTIVSDVRFINEANAIRKRQGYLIYIDRGLEFGTHPSEKEMKTLVDTKSFDFIIENKGTLKDLFNKVKNISANLLHK